MYDLIPCLAQKAARERLSVRQLARQMNVSFSALAKILRGETQRPSIHTDLAIKRFLGKDVPPCPCGKCQGHSALAPTLERLARELERLHLRLDDVEETQERFAHLLAKQRRRRA